MLEHICKLQRVGRAYEVYLQLYFTENIERNQDLNPIVGNNPIWFGNEVACGVGMQKIDILTINYSGGRKEYRIIELKDEPVQPEIVDQIEYYVNWASQKSGRHLEDAFETNIQPVVVAPPCNHNSWHSVVNAFKNYNRKGISLPILYFEYRVGYGKSISFEKVEY